MNNQDERIIKVVNAIVSRLIYKKFISLSEKNIYAENLLFDFKRMNLIEFYDKEKHNKVIAFIDDRMSDNYHSFSIDSLINFIQFRERKALEQKPKTEKEGFLSKIKDVKIELIIIKKSQHKNLSYFHQSFLETLTKEEIDYINNESSIRANKLNFENAKKLYN